MNHFIEFIPNFIHANLALIIALLALCLSVHALNVATKSIRTGTKAEPVAKPKNDPEPKPDILNMVERQYLMLGNYLLTMREILHIYKCDSRLFFKHTNDIERLKNSIQKIQSLQSIYEDFRSRAQKVETPADLLNLELTLAEARENHAHVEQDYLEEKKKLQDLKKFQNPS